MGRVVHLHGIGVRVERVVWFGATPFGIGKGDVESGLADGVTHVHHFLCHHGLSECNKPKSPRRKREVNCNNIFARREVVHALDSVVSIEGELDY